MDGGLNHLANRVRSAKLPCLGVFIFLLVAISIAQIAIGAVYLNECPKQRYIPLYLVVCGVFSIALVLSFSGLLYSKQEDGCSAKKNIPCYVWNGLVSAFLCCWLVTGSKWTYSIYQPNYNSTVPGELYCNKTLYLFAFSTITVPYIMLGIGLVAVCCMYIGVCLCVRCRK